MVERDEKICDYCGAVRRVGGCSVLEPAFMNRHRSIHTGR